MLTSKLSLSNQDTTLLFKKFQILLFAFMFVSLIEQSQFKCSFTVDSFLQIFVEKTVFS